MAQCKDCIHKGLCKISSEFIKNHDCELFVSPADVVPKSEVEQIKWERDVAIKQLEEIGLSFGEKTDGYGNLTEYAKQIFEKIEKALNNSVETEHFKGTWFNMSKFRQRIAELKKKYTKEGEDKE